MSTENTSNNRTQEMAKVNFLPSFIPLFQAFAEVREKTKFEGALYLSGGKVRDALLGDLNTYSDYDFYGDFDLNALSAMSNIEIVDFWPEMGVLKLNFNNKIFEFIVTNDIRKSLEANDINSSTLILTENGKIEDNFGGLDSIRRKEIKVNDPIPKFRKDPSQILRVFKFAELLNFTIEKNTLETISAMKHIIPEARKEDLDYEVKSILSLPERQKLKVINRLQRYKIYLEGFRMYRNEVDRCIEIENKIVANSTITTDIGNLFLKSELRLVGGAVREYIWGGKINDLDFILGKDIDETINNLDTHGYTESTNLILNPMEYYINRERNVISLFVNGNDIDIACVSKYEIDTIISSGDISFSCGIYNVHSNTLDNPEIVRTISNKELYFCNPDRIASDPLLVLSALKQISKVEDLRLSTDTITFIYKGIPLLIEYFRNNQDKQYKLDSICGNPFSGKVYQLFSQYGGEHLIKDSIRRRSVRSVTETYVSCSPEDISEDVKMQVVDLVSRAYKESFKPHKFKIESFTSLHYVSDNGAISSALMLKDSRIYCIASEKRDKLESLFVDVLEKNSNLWTTVNIESAKIQQIFEAVGFRKISSIQKAKSFLLERSRKNLENIVFELSNNGFVSFYDINNPNYKQFIYTHQN